MEELNCRLHDIRIEKGISLKTLADDTNLSEHTIIDIEKQRRIPTALTAARIAAYLQVSFDELFIYRAQ